MPLLIRLGLDNYAHARTVDTRPFFFGEVGPGNEAIQTLSRVQRRVWPRDYSHLWFMEIRTW